MSTDKAVMNTLINQAQNILQRKLFDEEILFLNPILKEKHDKDFKTVWFVSDENEYVVTVYVRCVNGYWYVAAYYDLYAEFSP